MKQSKAEIRAQLLNDTLTYVLKGGDIQEIPAQRKKIKITCSGKSARANTAGGSEPTFRISSLYNQ